MDNTPTGKAIQRLLRKYKTCLVMGLDENHEIHLSIGPEAQGTDADIFFMTLVLLAIQKDMVKMNSEEENEFWEKVREGVKNAQKKFSYSH